MKLSKAEVDRAKPKDRVYWLWDDDVSGLGVRVFPTGRKVLAVRYRVAGTPHQKNLGPWGILTLTAARDQARRTIASATLGEDRFEKPPETPARPTVADLAARYRRDHLPKKKPTSQREDERILDREILPSFGDLELAELTTRSVAEWHAGFADRPTMGNRCLFLFATLCNLAQRWELLEGANPCQHVTRFRESKRERFLSAEERTALAAALDAAEDRCRRGETPPTSGRAVDALRLLILTGARKNEVLRLRWSEVDFERGALVFDDTKAGRSNRPLIREAVALLARIRSESSRSEWVFPGAYSNRPLVNLDKTWRRVRAEAGLEGLRLHDLRHSFASAMAGAGISLSMIGSFLGHRSVASTSRYAHLAEPAQREAAERAGPHLTLEAIS